jgi:NAD-dependent SIR2 family protein deacetylase
MQELNHIESLYQNPEITSPHNQDIYACSQCDCFIMAGSSLTVSPANFMPSIAKKNGAQVIFVNLENTCMDDCADLFLKGRTGVILSEILEKLKANSLKLLDCLFDTADSITILNLLYFLSRTSTFV